MPPSKEGWTSIPVRPSVRDDLQGRKREGESWSEAIQRLLIPEQSSVEGDCVDR